MSNNNSQVAHLWAAQSRDSARTSNGNFSFRGRSLFSYQTEIARFIAGRVVYTRVSYSQTTEGKHKREIHGAVRHLESYGVNREMRSIPDTWEEVAPIIFADMMHGIRSQIESLRKARTLISWAIERIEELARNARKFFDSYLLESDHIGGFARFTNSAEMITLSQLRAMTAEEWALGKWSDIMREEFTIDLSAKFESERKWNEGKSIREANKTERERAERERRNAERVARNQKLQENIAAWPNDLSISSSEIYGAPMMLRINGSEIETSQGARIPIIAAHVLWRNLLAGENMIGHRVGDFRIDALTTEQITIGCHSIPMTELRRIAALLTLPPMSEDLTIASN